MLFAFWPSVSDGKKRMSPAGPSSVTRTPPVTGNETPNGPRPSLRDGKPLANVVRPKPALIAACVSVKAARRDGEKLPGFEPIESGLPRCVLALPRPRLRSSMAHCETPLC